MAEPVPPDDRDLPRQDESRSPEATRQMNRFHASDLIIELGMVPFAVLTVLGLLYYTGFHAEPGTDYGLPAIALGLGWLVILWLVDAVRYRHRAALLLSAPFVLVVPTGWVAVYELGMESRGLVEDCPVTGSRDYLVDPYRRSAYWETEYSLDCTQARATVTERLDGEPYEPPISASSTTLCTEWTSSTTRTRSLPRPSRSSTTLAVCSTPVMPKTSTTPVSPRRPSL